jgi:hypothetical protein
VDRRLLGQEAVRTAVDDEIGIGRVYVLGRDLAAHDRRFLE